jgi:hypothetical protein
MMEPMRVRGLSEDDTENRERDGNFAPGTIKGKTRRKEEEMFLFPRTRMSILITSG